MCAEFSAYNLPSISGCIRILLMTCILATHNFLHNMGINKTLKFKLQCRGLETPKLQSSHLDWILIHL